MGLNLLKKTPPIKTDNKSNEKKVVSVSDIRPVDQKTGLFVSYWSLVAGDQLQNYDNLIYFGITANLNGVQKGETGYINIPKFMTLGTPAQKKYLTLRLIDSNTNFDILKDVKIQKKIISETIAIAKENKFDGVVLDLELFSIFNDDIKDQISSFDKVFYTAVKEANLSYFFTVYGDVFYRKRPYDLKFIGENSDGIYVMAYDLHKSQGEPGPNFPLSGRDKYGYDLKLMIEDFKAVVPPDKLTVIFGLFGYDWTVDEKKRPVKPGRALNLKDMTSSFVDKCEWKNCFANRDPLSGEMEVNYVTDYFDPDPTTNPDKLYGIIYHDVWFEDMKSTETKKGFLKEQGITNFGYWVYGYF